MIALIAAYFFFSPTLPASQLLQIDLPFVSKNSSKLVNINNADAALSVSLAGDGQTRIRRIIDAINQEHNNVLTPFRTITFSMENEIPSDARVSSWRREDDTIINYSAVSVENDEKNHLLIIHSFIDQEALKAAGWSQFMIQDQLDRNFTEGLLSVIDKKSDLLAQRQSDLKNQLGKNFESNLFVIK